MALAQAAAAPAGGGNWSAPIAFLAGGIGLAIAAGLCGLGQGRVAASAVDAMARQPGAAPRIQVAMLLGLAFIESLTLYMFVIAIVLTLVKF